MKCYNSEEWAAYLYDENLDENKKREMEAHLRLCDRCRKDVESLEKTVELLKNYGQIEEEGGCIETELLYAYKNDELSQREKKRVEEHLKTCLKCQEDIKLFDKFPLKEEEEVEELKEVPDYLIGRIQDLYHLVYLEKEKAPSFQETIKEKIKNLAISISNIADIFSVSLVPQPVFRGTEQEFPQITCSGGDVVLSLSGKVDIKDIKVDLLDQNFNVIQTQKPNEIGQVWFEDVSPGKYYVKVKHHKAKITKL